MLGPEVDVATKRALRHAMGLDRPLLARYGGWIGGALGGDFGRSVRINEPVAAIPAEKPPVILELTLQGRSW